MERLDFKLLLCLGVGGSQLGDFLIELIDLSGKLLNVCVFRLVEGLEFLCQPGRQTFGFDHDLQQTGYLLVCRLQLDYFQCQLFL